MSTDVDPLPSNLHRLRKRRGLSQDAVAEAAGLSRLGYRAIEKGESEPKPESLRAIATALKVNVGELLAPAATLRRVRFRSLKRLKRREDVLDSVGKWLHGYNELEGLLNERRPNLLDGLNDVVKKHRSNLPRLATAVRERLGRGDEEPIHDICGLLESKGVKVYAVPVESDAFFGLSVAADDGGPAVVVNAWERIPVETWIFSAAHELGHLLMHLGAYDVTEEDESLDEEKEANVFASHFLMPEKAFRKEWNDTAGHAFFDRVMKVKRIFRVSWRTVLYRLDDQSVWARFSADYAARTSNSLKKHTEPEGVDPSFFQQDAGPEPSKLDAIDFKQDRLAALVRRAVESEKITLARGAEILELQLVDMRKLAASWAS